MGKGGPLLTQILRWDFPSQNFEGPFFEAQPTLDLKPNFTDANRTVTCQIYTTQNPNKKRRRQKNTNELKF